MTSETEISSISASPKTYKSPLFEMSQTTPTCLWNDSAALEELRYALEHGAVGATCNPTIVLDVLRQEMHIWRDHIVELIRDRPTATEDEIAWALIEKISAARAPLLQDIFEAHKGRNGRFSIQTDPHLYRNEKALAQQAVRFSKLAPNMIVKIPVTTAGVAAIEQATAEGVSINATVCFTVSQSIAVAEAIERGLATRERAGLNISTMTGSVCTIMVGRLDDWLKVVMDKQGIITDPGYLEWAGVAVFKKAYELFMQRGYRTRVLAAAYRNHMQWSELIGGDVVVTVPSKWQKRFNASDITVANRIGTPVDEKIVTELLKKFPDFGRAYHEHGLSIADFDTFGPTMRTLRQFMAACHDLRTEIRNVMIPNPDNCI